MQYEGIRIHHECEVWIEKSVLRITVLHNEACLVTTNGDREGWRVFAHRIRISDILSWASSSCPTHVDWLQSLNNFYQCVIS